MTLVNLRNFVDCIYKYNYYKAILNTITLFNMKEHRKNTNLSTFPYSYVEFSNGNVPRRLLMQYNKDYKPKNLPNIPVIEKQLKCIV